MATLIYENDWLTTNVLDFKINKDIEEVRCEFVPGDFEESSFVDAGIKVANTIKNKYEHIYVAYSGGNDTTFIVNTLHSVGANFTPIAIEAEHTTEELQRAYSNCKRLGLDLVVLDFMGEEKEQSLKRLFNHYILDRCNYSGMVAVSIFFFLIIHDYIKQIHTDAILITGEHIRFPFGRHICWDFFMDIWEKEAESILMFMMYNQHISYEMCRFMFKGTYTRFSGPSNMNPSYKNNFADMYEIPRVKKITGFANKNSEWKKYYMNAATWVNAGGSLAKYGIKGANDFQSIEESWKKLKS
jgi:hypothetical protein